MSKKSQPSSETLNQQILDSLGEGIMVIDDEGNILTLNKSLQRYLEKEQIAGISLGISIFHFIRQHPVFKGLEESLMAILNGNSSFFEHQISLSDGKWYGLKISPLQGAKGAVISFQNVNTRKEIEIALETSLKKYRNIYNRAPVMMHSVDREGKIISVSDFWLEKMGFDRNEIIGKSPKFFIHESFHEEQNRNHKILLEKGEIKNVNYSFRKKSGTYIDVVLGAVAEYDADGNFERSIAGMIDITDQKQIEKDLTESRIKLLESQRISKIGNYELDIESGTFQSSQELDHIMGFAQDDRDLSITKKLIHPDDLAEFMENLQECIQNNKDFFQIYRIFHLKTSKLKWISGRGKMISDNQGNVIKMIGTVQDITEQRTAEDKIKKLSDRILLSTDIANLGVWEYDADMDEVFWEDQMYSIFPNATSPYRLKELNEIIADDENFIDHNLELIQQGTSFIETEVKVLIDEEIKFLRTFTRIIRSGSDHLKGIVGVVYDITEDKKLQTKLELSLEEKNILIREVHHRVKNNMQLISSIMALKAYDLKDEESKEIFEGINTRIKAMSVIYDKLHKFYNVSEIDISSFLTQISKELEILLGIKSVIMKIDVLPEVMSIDHALVLGLIVSELVSNAFKHSFKEVEEGEIHIKLSKTGNDRLFLSVTNTGEKVPAGVLEGTTGIGISMIKTFVRQLKGEISLDEENGFRVEFSK